MSPFSQSINVLKTLQKDGHTVVRTCANKDVAIVILGDTKAVEKLVGEVLRIHENGKIWYVIFEQVIGDVRIRWGRFFDISFNLPDDSPIAELAKKHWSGQLISIVKKGIAS